MSSTVEEEDGVRMMVKAGFLRRLAVALLLCSVSLLVAQSPECRSQVKTVLDNYGPATNPLPPHSPDPASPKVQTEKPAENPAAGTQATVAPVQTALSVPVDNVYPGGVALDTLRSTMDSLSAAGWIGSETSVTNLSLSNADPSTDDLSLRQLQEFHCRDILTRSFQRGQRLVIVKIYRFESPSGAFGSYASLRRGSSTVVTRGDGSSESDQSISFWQGNCYFSLFTTAEDDDEAKEMLRALADNIGRTIRAHAEQPRIMTELPRLDRVAGSERLVMGPVVARQVFPAPYLGILSLEQSRAAALADYQFSAPYRERMKLLLIDYGNQALATSVYDKYVDNLGASHAVQDTGHISVFKMSNTYLLCSLQGGKVAIITGARRKLSPVMLARQLY